MNPTGPRAARRFFRSKIHRATVTHADLDYEGSLSVDADLLRAADILPYEEVHVWNVTNGARLTTYAIEGPAGSGVVCANGAAAHHVRPGDLVIIATFGYAEDPGPDYHPTVVRVDEENRVVGTEAEVPGPRPSGGTGT